jgi:hypothetical protein
MASQAKLRAAILRELFVRSKGSIGKPIPISELLPALGASSEEAMIVARQLKSKKLIDILAQALQEPRSVLSITMEGIEESERLEMPAHIRWPGEHTTAWPLIVGLFSSLFSIFFSQMLTLVFQRPSPPPIIQPIIQLPDGTKIKLPEVKEG